MSSSRENGVLIAIDDGHSHVKAILRGGNGVERRVRFESSARAGAMALVGLEGEESADVYLTEGQRYTVAPRRLLSDGLDTRTSDFPASPFNRVLVAHAIRQLGVKADAPLTIATGLPLKEWVSQDRPQRTQAKMANLATEVSSLSGWTRPAIASQTVLPEAISAYLAAIERRIVTAGEPVAVIDIGGRTMDVAIIHFEGKRALIDRDKSGSDEIGALGVRDRLRGLLSQKFQLDHVPDLLLDQALETRKVRLFNREEDCADLVSSAVHDVRTQAINAARHRIGQGATLSCVLLVGGGSHLLDLSGGWPHAQRIPDPEFANAEGMMVRLASGKQE